MVWSCEKESNDHILFKAAEMEVEVVRPRGRPKDMEAMYGTGYERKEYWGGNFSQSKK